MSSFKNLVNAVMKHGNSVIREDSPPGFKGTVKAMKDEGEVDNPYALAWWMKNKGYKSHKKASGAAKEKIGEAIRVWHPTHGTGVVNEIGESYINITWDNLQTRALLSANLPFSQAKYLSRLREEYSSKPSDVDYDSDKDSNDDDSEKPKHHKKKKAMKKDKEKIEEGMVSIGMSGIGGTIRPSTSDDLDLDSLTLADLMLEDEKESDSNEYSRKSSNSNGKKSSKRRSDYVNVPPPSDTVLTNQEKQPKYRPEPLSTHAGFEDATNGLEPDGDYGTDLLPVDAPEVPKVRDIDDTGNRKNTRKSGEGEDTHEASDKNIDFDGDKPEEDEDNQMKKKKYESNKFDLTANDLGLTESQHGEGSSGYAECAGDFDENYGEDDMSETHDVASGEVALTPDFMHKLFTAISTQSPDDSTLQALCDGLKSVSQETGETLDVSDWDAVKEKASEAYGGGSDAAVDDEVDSEPDAEMNAPEPELEPGADEHEDDAYFEELEDDDYDYEEDRAEGDGGIAGSEAGEEHEGKIKMMDKKKGKGSSGDRDDKNPGKEQRMKQRRDQRKSKQQGRYMEDGSSGTPVGQGSNKGPGGGGTTDLSKPKTYKGKALGTQTGSGPGGGSTSNDGQKPSPKGGSNLLPANDKGNQLGAAENPFSKGKENPRRQKALAAEARKRNNKKKLDEAIMLGMNSIPHIGGGGRNPEIPDDAYDDTDELKMIKRRAGMENWWK